MCPCNIKLFRLIPTRDTHFSVLLLSFSMIIIAFPVQFVENQVLCAPLDAIVL
jgi:hypothetical protein